MPIASSRGIRAGAAFVELFVNDRRLVMGLKRAQARMSAFGSAVTGIGMRMVGLAAAMATPFVIGAKVFATFEEQMAKVSTMLDEPEVFMKKFTRGIRDMSVEMGESTETLAGGLYDILSASIPAEKALEVLAVASRAAAAGMSDTKTAADAITTVLNAYGLSAEHAGDVSDLLFSIVKRGKTTFAEIAPAIGNVATIASSAGVSFEELGAALSVMTRSGVKTENAITALNAIISSFLKPTAEAAAYAKELGFEMSSATIQSEGLVGVFAKISKLPPDAISKLFPNIRALKGVLPALKNMEGFVGDISVMGARAGAAGDAYGKMTKTLMHSFRQLKQSIIGTFSYIGEALRGPLHEFTKKLKEWTAKIKNFVQQNHALIKAIAKIVLVIAGVGAALIVVGVMVSGLAKILGVLAFAVSVVTATFGALMAVLSFIITPIGLVVAAIAGLGIYILHSTGLAAKGVTWLKDKINDLKEDATAAWCGIRDALAAGDITLAMRVLWLTIKMEWTKGINFLQKAWLGFRNFFVGIAYDAWDGLRSAASTTMGWLESAWINTTWYLSKHWSNFTYYLLRSWFWVGKQLSKAWNNLKGLFDSEFDFEAANAAADAYYEQQVGGIEDIIALRADDTNRADELDAAAKSHAAKMADIERENMDRKKTLADEFEKSVAANEAELAEARREWHETIDIAKFRKGIHIARTEWSKFLNTKVGEPGKPGDGAKQPPSTTDVVEAIAEAIQKAVKIDVIGSFGASAADRLGIGSSVFDRTAAATEATAKYSKRVAEAVEEIEFTFE